MYTHFDDAVNVDRIEVLKKRIYTYSDGTKSWYKLHIDFSDNKNSLEWSFASEEERDNVFNDIINLHNKSTIST